MLLTFNDAITNGPVSVNTNYVVAVFTVAEGEHAGKTVIGMSNGNLVVNQEYLEVVGQIQGELK